MYKKKITYTNLNDEEVTETLYFSLSRKEALKIMNKYIGTDYDKKAVTDFISKVTKTKDVMTIISFIEDIILSAYGEKSEDGNRFKQKKLKINLKVLLLMLNCLRDLSRIQMN